MSPNPRYSIPHPQIQGRAVHNITIIDLVHGLPLNSTTGGCVVQSTFAESLREAGCTVREHVACSEEAASAVYAQLLDRSGGDSDGDYEGVILIDGIALLFLRDHIVDLQRSSTRRLVGFIHCPFSEPFYRDEPWLQTAFPSLMLDPYSEDGLFNEEIRLYALLDRILVVGQTCRSRLVANYAVPNEKLMVMNPSVHIPQYLPVLHATQRGTTSSSNKGFCFASVGTLCPRKNQLGLVEGVTRACTQHPNTFSGSKLILIGDDKADPDYTMEVRQSVLYWNAQQDVEICLVGAMHLEEALRKVSNCDAFLFNSLQESFALAPLEAACMGVPVISTRVGELSFYLPTKSTIWVHTEGYNHDHLEESEARLELSSCSDKAKGIECAIQFKSSVIGWEEALFQFGQWSHELQFHAQREAVTTRTQLQSGLFDTQKVVQELLSLQPKSECHTIVISDYKKVKGNNGLTYLKRSAGLNTDKVASLAGRPSDGVGVWIPVAKGAMLTSLNQVARQENEEMRGKREEGTEECEDQEVLLVRNATLRNAQVMCTAVLLANFGVESSRRVPFLVIAHSLLLGGLRPTLSAANTVTIFRGFLPAVVWWRAGRDFSQVEAVDILFFGVPFIVLDIVDGALARHSNTGPTRVGGALDVESDSLAALYLSLAASQQVWQGAVVAGVLRYIFVLATGARELPPSPIGGTGRFLAKWMALFTVMALWGAIAMKSVWLCQVGVFVLCLSFSVDFFQVFFGNNSYVN